MKQIENVPILSYIETNLTGDCSIGHIANHFGYSVEYFRHMFRESYGMSPGNYIRRRKLIAAVCRIQEGMSVTGAAFSYGFHTAAGFSKAFRKEFGFSADEFKNRGEFLEDVQMEPNYEQSHILVSYVQTPEIRMVGKALPREKCYEFDLLKECAYWLDHDFPKITEEEMDLLDAYKHDFIGMWYHSLENTNITYLAGPVVKTIGNVPEGMIPVVIPEQNYAVFEMKRESEGGELARDVRRLSWFISKEWVPANGIRKNKMGFLFERYRENRATVYLPIIREE